MNGYILAQIMVSMEVNYGKQMELKMVRSWLRIFDDGPGSSFPHSFTYSINEVVFAADDGDNGTELWKTNGTEEGTVMVKDIWNGSNGGVPNGLRY